MSGRLRHYAPVLRQLAKTSQKNRKKIIKKLPKEFTICMSEICRNILKGNVPLSRAQLARLRHHRKIVKKIALKKTTLKQKKKLIQKGGFLGAILTPILSILGGLLGNRS